MIWIKQVKGNGKEEMEDVIHIEENDEKIIVGIADGQTLKKYSSEGAKLSLREVADYLKKQKIDKIKDRYVDEIQYEILKSIREKLTTVAKTRKVDIEEFSSTLCIISVEKETGAFVILNLGDGIILAVTKENRIRILSFGERGLARNSTYLTTTNNALSHLRIGWGNISDYNSFILFTDGVRGICHGCNVSQRVAQMFITENYEDIGSEVDARADEDDATIVIIKPD